MSHGSGVGGAEALGDRGGGRRGLQRVGDGGDQDAADLLGPRDRPAASAFPAAATLMSMTVSSGAA